MSKRSLLRDVTGVVATRIFLITAGLLSSIVLSRNLGPENFGIYSAILVLPLVVVSFAQLGMRASSIFHIGRKQYEPGEIAGSVVLILVMTSMLGILITALGYLIMDEESFTGLYIILVLLSLPFRLAMAYFGGIFLGREQISRSNFINWFAEFLNLLAVLVFVWLLGWGIKGALISLLASQATISTWALFVIRRDIGIRLKFHPEVLKSLLSMGVLFATSFGIIQLNYRIDILLLQKLSTMEEVGFYSLGVSIAEKLWQLPLAIGVVLMSRTANADDQQMINRISARLVRVALLAVFLASVVLFVISPWIVPAIWGEKFRQSITTVQFILPGIIFISIYRVLNSRLSGIGKPQISIYVFAPALILNILLNLWWIPLWGSFGAVMATNASYTLGTLVYIFVYSKIVKMPVLQIFAYQKSDFDFLKRAKKWISG
ncbi:MAG: polysaccharide biosynthesis C-terminal domain-containing protein [Bacteroidales bacterium]|nr:polysaccharide biosynthesis C-terminal domain-containing protein [Bacteroidales bacterium]